MNTTIAVLDSSNKEVNAEFSVVIYLKVTSATKRSLLKMCHLRHKLRIFLFRRKIMFRSQDIQVFVFLAIP